MINDRLDGDLIGATTLSFFVPFLRLLGKISHRMGLRLDCSLFFFLMLLFFLVCSVLVERLGVCIAWGRNN
jgi:hypothetical protein